jgi:hypothetical protein
MSFRPVLVGGNAVPEPVPAPPRPEGVRILDDAKLREKDFVHTLVIGFYGDGTFYVDSTCEHYGDDCIILEGALAYTKELGEEAMLYPCDVEPPSE